MTATTPDAAREAVLERFVAQTTLPADRYTFDNEAFDPPAGQTWVRLTVRHLPSPQATLGPPGRRRYTRHARVLAQVFAPTDAGTRAADLVAQEVRGIFEGHSFDGLAFSPSADFRELPEDDAGWWGLVLDAPFSYQETR